MTPNNVSALAEEVKRLVSEYAEAWLARREGAKVDTASPLVSLHAAIDALAACAAQREWISVNDKLPEKNVEVMVFFEGASSLASTGQYTASKFDHDGWCYPKENFDDANDAWPTVTHWMPLPPAPVATPKEGA